MKRQNLRGSVTQNTTSQRGRARPEESRFHGLKVGLVAGGLCFLIIAAALLWHNRWPHRQARRLAESALATTQKARFAVRDVIVEGRLHTEKDELFAALGTEANAPILAFDPDEAREKISQLPWVAAVTIERRLPDTILVRLTERQPLARWQHNNKTVVIDATGAVLATAKPELFATLPLVVG
ncbi:MAG: FtsQ-type POTRA domain-containing protein [Alphaproteobacteria bacterium]|nr:FtsQ-type POTRA domain-containing protein [Alphaproteobacteria bacterium]